ncbi:MAG: hypothetical protein PHS49_03240 [Candidatus Gracilibacteria bacterium]|nr:hypothetical protein [Candidatus Gracilibacteria bacterium]
MDTKLKLMAIGVLAGSINSTVDTNIPDLNDYVSREIRLENIKNDVKKGVSELIDLSNQNLSISRHKFENPYFSEDTLISNKQKEVYDSIKIDIMQNMDIYSVLKGNTLAQISNDFGLSNYNDLLLLNSLLGKEFRLKNGKKHLVLLSLGEQLFVPKIGKVDTINENLVLLKDIKSTLDLNEIVLSDNSENKNILGEKIYPTKVRGVGIEKMLGGFIGAQKLEFDPYLPHIVDVSRQETVSCANLIRTLMAFSVDRKYLSEEEKSFFRKQGLDAWILPEALKKIGYVQTHNLMNNFSTSMIGSQNPIPKENQEAYENDVIELGKYLETQGVPGTIVPLYFKYSRYKGVVAGYNRGKTDKHYNTHQTIFAGTDTVAFDAKNVGIVKNGFIKPFEELKEGEMTVFDFMTNFIQQRGDYGRSALADWQKKVVQEKLLKITSLIHIKVNGNEVNLGEEFAKSKDDMFKIFPDDKIELYGPIVIDGLHMVNSDDSDKRKNMNARTRFYFEMIGIDTFYVSESLEPQNGSIGVGVNHNEIFNKLVSKGVYALKKGDTAESAIKDKILRYEKDIFDKLDINASDYQAQYDSLLNHYFGLQIKALKITGYMQSENDINKGSFNINAPIVYFDTKNIDEVFVEFISQRKQDKKSPDEKLHIMRSYVQDTTFPLDNYKSVVNRVGEELAFQAKYNGDIFPNLKLFSEFNELQQRKFLELFLNYAKKSKEINVKEFLNGKINEGINVIMSLKDADKIVYDISQESYSADLDLSPADEFAIDLVAKLDQNNKILENILLVENYTPVGSHGLKRILKQTLEYNPSLQQDFTIMGKRIKSIISSYGDFQIRLTNLNKGLYEEWPNKKQLLKAFSFLESNEFKDYLSLMDNTYASRVNEDLRIVGQIKSLVLNYDLVDDETKKIYLTTIKEQLQQILLLDDGTGSNIVGKIVGASLVNDKLNLHFQKFNGILQASGEKLDDIYNDTEKMQSYEKITMLINNLGERNVVYGLTENYIIRIFQTVESVIGKKYSYPKLEKTSLLGQFKYGSEVFKRDIGIYVSVLSEIKTELKPIYDSNNNEHIALGNMLFELENILLEFSDEKSNKYTIKKIYDLFKNQKIKQGLAFLDNSNSSNLQTSILPLESEFAGVDFRNTFFRYLNTSDLERLPPGFISQYVPKII